jgi:hypothetical protein
VPFQQRTADPLQQCRIAIAEGDAGLEPKRPVRAFGQAHQLRFDAGHQLAAADRQGGRLVVERADDVGTIGSGEAVVERQEGAGSH